MKSKQLLDYSSLDKQANKKFLISLDSSGILNLYILLYIKDELKTFALKLTKTNLKSIEDDTFNINSLEYFDVAKKAKEFKHDFKEVSHLTYLLDKIK